ncbi:MAG: hypothetical protein HOP18_17370 [Deltaproteobacteria bacterium]|nr:hypothetical protein [Deltaproteobacteria bacterium]
MKDRPVYGPYRQKDTAEAYKEFIAKYPNNAFIPEAQDRLAELEYAPYRNLNTIAAYQDFLFRYPSHKYAQDALAHLAQLQHPAEPLNPYHPHLSELIVTSGSLSQPYEVLGSIHADTVGVINMGAVFTDALFRSPLERAIQRTPTQTTEQMNRMLRDNALQQYGHRVDAIINVTYRTESSGTVYADGLAVHFMPQSPLPAPAAPVRNAEDRLKEIRKLLDQGLINKEEYERKRSEILKDL